MDLAGRLGALQERDFRLFFLGQTTSLLGDGMVSVALAFAVLDLTGSVQDLGFVFAARSSRSTLVGAFAIMTGVNLAALSTRSIRTVRSRAQL